VRTAALLILVSLAKAQSPSDRSWKNLSHTFKEASYTVAMRDGRCVTGHIASFDDRYVTVGSSELDRKDVVRIADETSVGEVHGPIYSTASPTSMS
jgi:hypothetical protein